MFIKAAVFPGHPTGCVLMEICWCGEMSCCVYSSVELLPALFSVSVNGGCFPVWRFWPRPFLFLFFVTKNIHLLRSSTLFDSSGTGCRRIRD